MPKIPMIQTGRVQGAGIGVNAPSLDVTAGLRNTAKSLTDLGETIPKTIGTEGGVLSMVQEMREKEAAVKDSLSMAEARNLYREITAGLKQRMAENPQDYSQFDEWNKESQKDYEDRVRPYLDAMTHDSRQRFLTEMDGIRMQTGADISLMKSQAGITDSYNKFQAVWKDSALRGDLPENRRLLEEAYANKLISEGEYTEKKADYSRMAEFGEVKALIQSEINGIADKLKEREGGRYLQWQNLSEGDRDTLTRLAEQKELEREGEHDEWILKEMEQGFSPYVVKEEIERDFRDGRINRRQWKKYGAWCDTLIENRRKEQEALDAAERKALDAAEKQRTEKEKTAAAEEEKKRKEDLGIKVKRFEFDIAENLHFTSMHEKNREILKDFKERVYSQFTGEDEIEQILPLIEKAKARELEVRTGKDVFENTEEGKQVLAYIENNFREIGKDKQVKYKGLIYDDPWYFRPGYSDLPSTQLEMNNFYYLLKDTARTALKEGKTTGQTIELVEKMRQVIKDGVKEKNKEQFLHEFYTLFTDGVTSDELMKNIKAGK